MINVNSNLPTFTIQDGYGQTREYVLDSNEITIGREQDCDIIINTNDASRHHAKVTRKNGVFVVEDMQSVNGTFVNSSPANKPRTIKHMDIIQIGACMLVFNDPDNPSLDEEATATRSLENMNFSFDFIKYVIRKLEENIGLVFKGKPEIIRNMVVCLFADGHLLIEDVPGVGKSILAQTLAKSIQAAYKRIQFTPDMLPSDITGMNIFDESERRFHFIPGPIFGNVVLADEINRTTPRTQSSLLECMSESVITIDGRTHVLPKPFFVIATQNPEDYHGTYPLPEPQLDRFIMRLSIGYPTPQAEKEILSSQAMSHPLNEISYVIKATDVVHCHALVRKVLVSDNIKNYIISICNATRKHPALSNGCSPRASLALMRVCQSLAAYYGRNYVIPRDVREMAAPVLAHRVKLKIRYQGEWTRVENVIKSIIDSIPMKNEDKGL
ncbi:MAG: FHA domain-containing protein [Lentisphaerae bacterium]|nr:FHA domain-containing protein [Lentisphaerota bacterium]MCP4103490.1 FHA domain-containing protein [Lentisphaerota bacterium]